MATAIGYVGSFIYGLFAGAGSAAAGAGYSTAAATAASAGGSAAAGVGAGTAIGTAATSVTVSEAAAVASGASALTTLAQGNPKVNIPPVPLSTTNDPTVQETEQQELARRAAAGGLQSTIGTAGGQQGAILNPATVSQRSLLGA